MLLEVWGPYSSLQKHFCRDTKFMLLQFFKKLFNKPQFRVIVQNSHDYEIFQTKADIHPSNLRLIPSAGVELHKFSVLKIESEVPTVILASRMLWDKGVGEFVTAAMELKSEGFKASLFWLATQIQKTLTQSLRGSSVIGTIQAL